jgi:hypothetical protein
LRISGISSAVVLVCVVVAVVIGGAAWLLILPGGVALVLAIATLIFGSGRTVLTPDGIRTHRLIFSWHSCRWPDVTSIDVVKTRGRETRYSWIAVTRASGSSFRLTAPYDASSKGDGDPEFSAEYRRIHDYWTQRRAQLIDSQ